MNIYIYINIQHVFSSVTARALQTPRKLKNIMYFLLRCSRCFLSMGEWRRERRFVLLSAQQAAGGRLGRVLLLPRHRRRHLMEERSGGERGVLVGDSPIEARVCLPARRLARPFLSHLFGYLRISLLLLPLPLLRRRLRYQREREGEARNSTSVLG